MRYFEKYTSNTTASAMNQYYFINEDPEKEMTGRVFYKIFSGGKYNYSFLFSNIIDSTYAEGTVSHMNLVCDEWEIVSARVGLSDTCDMEVMPEVYCLKELLFDGKSSKTVAPGEFFSSDAIEIDARGGQYLCLEITFKGRMIPYHEESLLPLFALENGEWKHGRKMPIATMVGCDRPVKGRIGFIGDSITQGIGTPKNSYEHYAAVVAELLGEEYSYWDIGIGYGRGNDAATDSAWLFKAKQLDLITVCFGVNDIFRDFTADQIIKSLETIMAKLKEAGVKVLIQTVPPYDYAGAMIEKWIKVNDHIRNSMRERADGYFDVVPVLGRSVEEPHMAAYGGHPNSTGNRLWGESLAPEVEKLAKKL